MTVARYSANMRPSPCAAGEFELIVTADGEDNTSELEGLRVSKKITKVTLRSTYSSKYKDVEQKFHKEKFGQDVSIATGAYHYFPELVRLLSSHLEAIDINLDGLYFMSGKGREAARTLEDENRRKMKLFFELFGVCDASPLVTTQAGVLNTCKKLKYVKYHDWYVTTEIPLSVYTTQAWTMAYFLFTNESVEILNCISLTAASFVEDEDEDGLFFPRFPFENKIILAISMSLINRDVSCDAIDSVRGVFLINAMRESRSQYFRDKRIQKWDDQAENKMIEKHNEEYGTMFEQFKKLLAYYVRDNHVTYYKRSDQIPRIGNHTAARNFIDKMYDTFLLKMPRNFELLKY